MNLVRYVRIKILSIIFLADFKHSSLLNSSKTSFDTNNNLSDNIVLMKSTNIVDNEKSNDGGLID